MTGGGESSSTSRRFQPPDFTIPPDLNIHTSTLPSKPVNPLPPGPQISSTNPLNTGPRIPTRVMSSFTRTPEMMPPCGHKEAPPKFTGSHEEIKRFLKRFNQLCTVYQVDGAGKCDRVVDYCSRKVGQLVEALESYRDKDWSKLEKDMLSYFDAELRETRFIVRDLLMLTRKWKATEITTLTRWKRYERQFVTKAGWLHVKGKISDNEQAAYFWNGINKRLRNIIETRLLMKQPNTDMTTPFPIEDIKKVVENIFERNRFDFNLADSDSDLPDFGDEYDSDMSSEESSEEESASERRKRKKKDKRAKRKRTPKRNLDSEDEQPRSDSVTRRVAGRSTSHGQPTDKRTSQPQQQDEVENLIKQLNGMSLEDPKYGLTYFKAIKLDPDVAQCVKAPATQGFPPRNNPRNHNISMPPTSMSPSNPGVMGTTGSGPLTCYGCGETGHGLRNCLKIDNLLKSGVITKDSFGRITHTDGTIIRRLPNEGIVQAAERLQSVAQAQSHFFVEQSGLEDSSDYYLTSDQDDEESEDDQAHVMAVDKSAQKKKEVGKKQVFDGVHLPSLKNVLKGKGKENAAPRQVAFKPGPAPITRSQGIGPAPILVPSSSNTDLRRDPNEELQQTRPKPFDARSTRHAVPDSDIDMQDVSNQTHTRKPVIRNPPNEVNRVPVKPKPAGRQSEISTNIGETQVVNQILNTPVTLRVREVLASSRELSDQISDMIKRKNIKPSIVASMISKDRGPLIKLDMECDTRPITAIIDTGSQLNVVSRKAWRAIIRRPINARKILTMSDANGGEGRLRGLCTRVPLTCGAITTQANLFIGEQVPFDLLLGRPWQRGNFVTIDERSDGTYLVFKNPKDPNNIDTQQEVLVAEELEPSGFSQETLTWEATNPWCNTVSVTPVPPNLETMDHSHANVKALSMACDCCISQHPSACDSASQHQISCNSSMKDYLPAFTLPGPLSEILNHMVNRLRQEWPAATNNNISEFQNHTHVLSMNPAQIMAGLNSVDNGNGRIAEINKLEQDEGVTFPFKTTQSPWSLEMSDIESTSGVEPLNLLPNRCSPPPPVPWSRSGLTDLETVECAMNRMQTSLDRPHPLVIASPFSIRFPEELDSQGVAFEPGVCLNTSIFIHTDTGIPSIRTGHLVYQFFPNLDQEPSSPSSIDTPPSDSNHLVSHLEDTLDEVPNPTVLIPLTYPPFIPPPNLAYPPGLESIETDSDETKSDDSSHILPTRHLDPANEFARSLAQQIDECDEPSSIDPHITEYSCGSWPDNRYGRGSEDELSLLNTPHLTPRILIMQEPQRNLYRPHSPPLRYPYIPRRKYKYRSGLISWEDRVGLQHGNSIAEVDGRGSPDSDISMDSMPDLETIRSSSDTSMSDIDDSDFTYDMDVSSSSDEETYSYTTSETSMDIYSSPLQPPALAFHATIAAPSLQGLETQPHSAFEQKGLPKDTDPFSEPLSQAKVRPFSLPRRFLPSALPPRPLSLSMPRRPLRAALPNYLISYNDLICDDPATFDHIFTLNNVIPHVATIPDPHACNPMYGLPDHVMKNFFGNNFANTEGFISAPFVHAHFTAEFEDVWKDELELGKQALKEREDRCASELTTIDWTLRPVVNGYDLLVGPTAAIYARLTAPQLLTPTTDKITNNDPSTPLPLSKSRRFDSLIPEPLDVPFESFRLTFPSSQTQDLRLHPAVTINWDPQNAIVTRNPTPYAFKTYAAPIHIPHDIQHSPWLPRLSQLREIRSHLVEGIKRLIAEITCLNWREWIDRLESSDGFRHYFYEHCPYFRFMEPTRSLHKQGFAHTCTHAIDYPSDSTIHPLLSPEENTFLLISAKLFAFAGWVDVAEWINFGRDAKVHAEGKAHKLFEFGLLDPYPEFQVLGCRRSFFL